MARQSAHQTKPNPEKSPRRDPTASGQRDAAVNRIASHNYFLLEKFETGIVLSGIGSAAVSYGFGEHPAPVPSPSPTPNPHPTTRPGGGGLPRTGEPLAVIAGTGAAALVVGTLLVLLARRRRLSR